eukprot:CAMPEP_0185177618 /NCGR_PEP_ID=MMETSP1139-20130426/29956_1 /TAXON_ID=298111 /ORGANISM="Pavlova sp., Strain CCMP459" /LENGTH=41 /DNA_ID=CAMNT_0027743415 /DNA_START=185 /DNA_END=306 /DNA_ORIENTATION=+
MAARPSRKAEMASAHAWVAGGMLAKLTRKCPGIPAADPGMT